MNTHHPESATALPTDRVVRADVVVVGGGPVGSALALDLARRGVDVLVLDRRTRIQDENVRARNISPRTLELCRRWGIADRFRAAQTLPDSWHRGTVVATAVTGHELTPPIGAGRPTWSPGADWRTLAAEAPQDLPQYHVNRILRERATELGARHALGWEVESLDQHDDSVRLRARSVDGQQAEVEAAWVVGCDGGRSVVRRGAGIELVENPALGRYHNFVFRLPGGFDTLGVDPAVLFMVFNRDVHGLIAPFEPDLWRVGIGPTPVDVELGTDELLARTRRYLGVGPDVELEAVSLSTHLVQKRVADRLRSGRVLIAGDAMQAFPPHLGQNLNSGVASAAMLAWALAGRVQGWGGDELLAAYEHERLAVAHRLADATMANAAGMAGLRDHLASLTALEEDGPEGDAVRAELGATLREQLGASADGIVHDHRFPDSPIVVVDPVAAPVPEDPARVVPAVRAGHRAPHVWLTDGTPLVDHLSDWFTLLDLGGDGREAAAVVDAAAELGVPLDVVPVADERVRAAYATRWVLVRPDVVIAWSGDTLPADGHDVRALLDVVRGARSVVAA